MALSLSMILRLPEGHALIQALSYMGEEPTAI
eukprot:Gb_33322 [translate_table: standard]